jgi:hypothetical protein
MSFKHQPLPRELLTAAGFPDPAVKTRRKGPDFSREGDVLYPETEEAQQFIDDSEEHELDFSGGIVWTEEIADSIRYAGLVVEGD